MEEEEPRLTVRSRRCCWRCVPRALVVAAVLIARPGTGVGWSVRSGLLSL